MGLLVGTHLRNELHHMAHLSEDDADGCKINMTLIIHQTRAFMRKVNTSTVLIATDNPRSICTKSFTNIFHPVVVIFNKYTFDLVQEAMGHTAAFVGSAHSTFSMAINDKRMLDTTILMMKTACYSTCSQIVLSKGF